MQRIQKKAIALLALTAFFLKELARANLTITRQVLAGPSRLRPAIVALPLAVERDIEITLFSWFVTLAPGVLALDVSSDRRVLFVHTLSVETIETFRTSRKDSLERWIREIFSDR
jgi:multicomponent Na+:H+ antiporter subunit E